MKRKQIMCQRQNTIYREKDFKALAEGQLDAQRMGHFISDYDYEITLKVAEALSGGDIPRKLTLIKDTCKT